MIAIPWPPQRCRPRPHRQTIMATTPITAFGREALSARRDVGRSRSELCSVFRECNPRRVVPIYGRGVDNRITSRFAGGDRSGLARLLSGPAAGADLWLPRSRPVRAGKRASIQSEQDRSRSVRQGIRPRRSSGATRCSATRSATPRPTCRSTLGTMPRQPLLPQSSTGLYVG